MESTNMIGYLEVLAGPQLRAWDAFLGEVRAAHPDEARAGLSTRVKPTRWVERGNGFAWTSYLVMDLPVGVDDQPVTHHISVGWSKGAGEPTVTADNGRGDRVEIRRKDWADRGEAGLLRDLHFVAELIGLL